MRIISVLIATCLFVAIFHGVGRAVDLNAEMTKFIQELEDQAKKQDSSFKGFTAEKGKKLFFDSQPNIQTGTMSCTTCHTTDLKMSGKTLVGKVLEPLAPSVNKIRLTNVKDVEKWLLRNFKQVYDREGTAQEKGDVLMFINAQ
jgi:cytochrome c peroxidase